MMRQDYLARGMLIAIVSFLAGCHAIPHMLAYTFTPRPTAGEIKAANFGSRPSTNAMETEVKAYMSRFDPDSVVQSCSPPIKAWLIAGPGEDVVSGKTYFGYLSVCPVKVRHLGIGYIEKYTFMIHEEGGRKLAFFSSRIDFGQVPE